MEIKQTAQEHVDRLNAMYKLDPLAVGSMMQLRVFANEKLSDSELCAVGKGQTLSPLALINALYPIDKKNNFPIARVEDISSGENKGPVTGFCLNSNYDFDGMQF